jgi:8-oxo-dGTP pyrophosphatase MutT (NUDIX family)
VLDLKLDRDPVPPVDAATIVLVRDGSSGGLEVFCVERSKQSRFMGGAIVFPGGKLDPGDGDDAWSPLAAPLTPRAEASAFTRPLAIAACRETLEEAALLPLAGAGAGEVGDADLQTLRAELGAEPGALRRFLAARGLRLDLGALRPLARWVTPTAEARRFDARFFLAVAPKTQTGAHDERETMASFWAAPAEVLRRWEAGDVQLFPPTHRTLALLRTCHDSAAAVALADGACLEPICPRLVKAEGTMALVLPGDPEHEIEGVRVPGRSRYVLRGARWVDEDAPR